MYSYNQPVSQIRFKTILNDDGHSRTCVFEVNFFYAKWLYCRILFTTLGFAILIYTILTHKNTISFLSFSWTALNQAHETFINKQCINIKTCINKTCINTM